MLWYYYIPYDRHSINNIDLRGKQMLWGGFCWIFGIFGNFHLKGCKSFSFRYFLKITFKKWFLYIGDASKKWGGKSENSALYSPFLNVQVDKSHRNIIFLASKIILCVTPVLQHRAGIFRLYSYKFVCVTRITQSNKVGVGVYGHTLKTCSQPL